jgi:cyclic-di-GMP-binding protein
MTSVRLKVPSPGSTSEFSGYSLAQLSAWVEALPRANADACARILDDALNALNGSKLNKAPRFQVMELVRPTVIDMAAALAARYKSQALPLGEAFLVHAQNVQRLLSALAIGFKIVVNEQLDAWEAGGDERVAETLQLATQRALLILGRGQLEAYRIYSPEPPQLWQELNTLYRNAELYNLQSLPVEATRDSDETAMSIKQAYLRVAVLALANPYHLMQGEAEDLYRRIGRWVHFVRIRKALEGESLPGRFVIDLSADFPARYLPHSLKLPPPRQPRVLELEQLVEVIAQQIQRFNESMARSGVSVTLSERLQRDMYARFRDALGGREERADERKPTVAKLAVVEGLSACHFYLNARRPFDPEGAEVVWQERLAKADPEPAEHLCLLEDEFSAHAKRGDRYSQFQVLNAEVDDVWRKANMIVAPVEERKTRRSGYRAVDWHRKNESQGGMALFCAQRCPMQVRVGELLAHADEQNPNPEDWRLGAVRWLRTRPNGGLELGVKYLAANGYPVGTKAVAGAGRGSEYLRGILIPRVNPLTHAATLLTAAAVYDVGTVLRLNLGELVIHAKLTEMVETTRQFAHFRFTVVEAPLSERKREK